MLRRSPSRTQRSKGFRVKHALQIFLLLAVCIWLLYQVKHSHDKKKAFDESTAKLSEKVESEHEILKFGRKDLHPRAEETTSENERHNEEEETGEEEESKHEEESKLEESEDEGRGGGDDEIDERDQERTEHEAEREEDFVDEEEKESEEESEEKEVQIEDVDSSEDQDRERNTQEAREENYKGDDASSAVVRNTQVISTEAENGGLGNMKKEELLENTEKDEVGHEIKTNGTDGVTSDQNDLKLKEGDSETIEGNPSVNATVRDEKGSAIALFESEYGSQPNSTTTTESNNQPEVKKNSTAENTGTLILSPQNGTDVSSGLTQDQNATVEMVTSNGGDSNLQTVVLEQTENSNTTTGAEQADSNSTLSTTTENADAAKGEFTDSSGNGDAAQGEKSGTNAGSTTNENADAVQSEPIDSTDSSIPQEEKDARTDLGTLPEIETEGKNSKDVASE